MYMTLAWLMMYRSHEVLEPRAGITFCSSTGKYRTDDAKMIGITPAWLTFSGMYVLPPEVILRPTTRFANCTGIRRWPCSM